MKAAISFAGIAQQTERPDPFREGTGKNPVPRSTITIAIAQGMQIDDAARAVGYDDGCAGRPCRAGSLDLLSYACGYAAGERMRGLRPCS